MVTDLLHRSRTRFVVKVQVRTLPTRHKTTVSTKHAIRDTQLLLTVCKLTVLPMRTGDTVLQRIAQTSERHVSPLLRSKIGERLCPPLIHTILVARGNIQTNGGGAQTNGGGAQTTGGEAQTTGGEAQGGAA